MRRAVGIVGSEAAKFTSRTERDARRIIRALIEDFDVVVSGKCHLGGIDIWAAEEGRAAGKKVIEHEPEVLSWSAGYRPRNIEIAKDSDEVYCITIEKYPVGYSGMRFDYCYHCATRAHVKSGGCWTVKYARGLGKPGQVIVI